MINNGDAHNGIQRRRSGGGGNTNYFLGVRWTTIINREFGKRFLFAKFTFRSLLNVL